MSPRPNNSQYRRGILGHHWSNRWSLNMCNSWLGRASRWVALTVAIAAVGACLTGCSESAPSSAETSGPVLTWSVFNSHTRETHTYPAHAVIYAGSEDEGFSVVFKANDAGGVKSITLGGGSNWQCVNGDVASQKVGDGVQRTSNFHANSNGQVEDYEFMVASVNVAAWDCQSGYTFGGGTYGLDGSASNYSSKVSNATLKIGRSG
jgi:hypothetical protein